MEPFTTLTGRAAPLLLANLDTDVIIRVERLTATDQSTLGQFAFEALRYRPDGSENPEFVLNQPPFRSAPILLGGPNFGCGSSREGAVTAIQQMGVRCIIAPSFGDIFYSNCFQNGLLAIRLAEADVTALSARLAHDGELTIDLERQVVMVGNELYRFEIDRNRRESLLEGLDDIGLTLKQLDMIRAFQAADRTSRPWVWDPVAVDAPANPTGNMPR
jgi:3-isopropylmalate/(R)-2-methylmalate dehydratase small subunit